MYVSEYPLTWSYATKEDDRVSIHTVQAKLSVTSADLDDKGNLLCPKTRAVLAGSLLPERVMQDVKYVPTSETWAQWLAIKATDVIHKVYPNDPPRVLSAEVTFNGVKSTFYVDPLDA